jgi:uncharacterized membrane protein YccF (DUF307 family)
VTLVLNVLWLALAGIWLFLGYVAAGVGTALTIVGIPWAIQAFKLAVFSLWPFGRAAYRNHAASATWSVIGNVVWVIIGGWWLALAHFLTGVLLVITVIGIPFGIANFKLAGVALLPFGVDIVDRKTAPAGAVTVA